MAWELALALETLRRQVNERSPGRRKVSDGTIGDAAHASRTSDHNPHIKYGRLGIVSALDITHDPGNDVDTHMKGEWLRRARDVRIKYVISNRRIFSSLTSPWTWRSYTGSNPHTVHIHISVRSERQYYNDGREWDLSGWERGEAGNSRVEVEAARPVLRVGSRGEEVRTVQRLLQLGLIDGIFGAITERAVRDFQRYNKLTVDGIVGPRTWHALDQLEQVILPYGGVRELSVPERGEGEQGL